MFSRTFHAHDDFYLSLGARDLGWTRDYSAAAGFNADGAVGYVLGMTRLYRG
jgi:hypothetical protein